MNSKHLRPRRTAVKEFFLIVVGAIVVAGAGFSIPTLWFRPWSIDHFYARLCLQFALRRPMLLSSLRIREPMGIDFYLDDPDEMSATLQRLCRPAHAISQWPELFSLDSNQFCDI